MDDFRYIKIRKPGSTLSFMNLKNQEVEGEIISTEIYLTQYENNIVYEVLYLGSAVKVDGELYRIIK